MGNSYINKIWKFRYRLTSCSCHQVPRSARARPSRRMLATCSEFILSFFVSDWSMHSSNTYLESNQFLITVRFERFFYCGMHCLMSVRLTETSMKLFSTSERGWVHYSETRINQGLFVYWTKPRKRRRFEDTDTCPCTQHNACTYMGMIQLWICKEYFKRYYFSNSIETLVIDSLILQIALNNDTKAR